MARGRPGALRKYLVDGVEVHPKARYNLKPGSVIEILDAGGGGYGDPALRDPRAIAEDIEQGFVTLEAARRDYGFEAQAEVAA